MSANTNPVEVRLFGPLREIIGRRSVTVPYAGMTMRDALVRFADERGTVIRHMLFDSQGNRRPSIIFLLTRWWSGSAL